MRFNLKYLLMKKLSALLLALFLVLPAIFCANADASAVSRRGYEQIHSCLHAVKQEWIVCAGRPRRKELLPGLSGHDTAFIQYFIQYSIYLLHNLSSSSNSSASSKDMNSDPSLFRPGRLCNPDGFLLKSLSCLRKQSSVPLTPSVQLRH